LKQRLKSETLNFSYERRSMNKILPLLLLGLALTGSFLSRSVLAQGLNPQAEIPVVPNLVDTLMYSGDGLFGPKDASVVVIALLDRTIPSAETEVPILAAIAATDPKVAILIRELPLSGPKSVTAARLVTAVRLEAGQVRARAFEGVIAASPVLDDTTLNNAISYAGLDPANIRQKATSPEVTTYLRQTRSFASTLTIRGIPVMLFQSETGRTSAIIGAQNIESLRQKIAALRK
jgi:protein-disulfide isomerase